jgi:hypothetical protein
VTTVDSRWYIKPTENKVTGLPEYLYVPSSTWICSYYPKGVSFMKYIASKGWDKAEEIKNAAGDKGTRVHKGLELIFDGQEIDMQQALPDSDGNISVIGLGEYECMKSAVDWANERQPESIKGEFVIFNEEYGYAGTVDRLFKIGDELHLVDFKTSQEIWPEHELQLSSYAHCINPKDFGFETLHRTILQLGYWRNKKMFKETEVPDKFDLFLSTKKIWENECAGEKPKQKDYPLTLKYEPKVELDKTNKING